MHHNHTLDIAMGNKAPHGPMHPDPAIVDDLTRRAPGCMAESPPIPYAAWMSPYQCSRSRGHDGVHVAGTDMQGHYIAEWDSDRATDLEDA